MTVRNKKIQLPAYTRHDGLVMLAVVPLQILICNYLLLGDRYFQDIGVFLTATLIYFAFMFVVFQLCGMLALAFLRRMPEVRDTPKRLFFSTICYILVTFSHITPLMWVFEHISSLNYHREALVDWRVALVGVVGNIIITLIFEGLAAFERWKASLYETEQLKKENISSQLQGLKNQMNPHILFNSFNALSSLISEDQAKAEAFLNEMSRVYRYLLNKNEDCLTPLTAELQFISSYYHLLKTRYPDGLCLHIHVPENCADKCLPRFTLQALVENAIRHNSIAKDSPLHITISCPHELELAVENNLQPKLSVLPTEKAGLDTIAARYKLLHNNPISVEENPERFCVKVPLIYIPKPTPC